eukprot:6015072-Alexandrium_andersonii.AAC.1
MVRRTASRPRRQVGASRVAPSAHTDPSPLRWPLPGPPGGGRRLPRMWRVGAAAQACASADGQTRAHARTRTHARITRAGK